MPSAAMTFKDLNLSEMSRQIGAKIPEIYNTLCPEYYSLLTDPITELLLIDPAVSEFVTDRLQKAMELEFIENFKPLDAAEKLIVASLIKGAKEAIDEQIKKMEDKKKDAAKKNANPKTVKDTSESFV